MNNTSWWKNKCHQTWNSIQCAPIVHHGESDVFPFWRISTILDTWTFPLYFIQWGDCWTSPTIFLRAYSSKISQTKENVMNDHGLVTCHHFKCETPPNTCLWISFFFFSGWSFRMYTKAPFFWMERENGFAFKLDALGLITSLVWIKSILGACKFSRTEIRKSDKERRKKRHRVHSTFWIIYHQHSVDKPYNCAFWLCEVNPSYSRYDKQF